MCKLYTSSSAHYVAHILRVPINEQLRFEPLSVNEFRQVNALEDLGTEWITKRQHVLVERTCRKEIWILTPYLIAKVESSINHITFLCLNFLTCKMRDSRLDHL